MEPAPRPLPYAWADFMRGAVRCMFPVASLAVLAALLYSGQGRDVLRALVSAATQRPGQDTAIAGLAFLLAASATLSASVWYAGRWLLTAQMAALPLPPTGFWQTWLPRLFGLAAPLMVAVGIAGLNGGELQLQGAERDTALVWAGWFALLGASLLAFYIARGALIVRMGLDDGAGARAPTAQGSRPAQIGVAEETPRNTRQVMIWSIAVSLALALLFFLFPITLPRVVGAAAVAALALASINLFGSFVLTYVPLRLALPPLWVWVILVAGLVFGHFNDNHVVQAARTQTAPAAVAAPDALQALVERVPRDGVPIFVASEGGGLRAAYWTAAVLDALDALDPTLKQRYVMLSGVSGGSLGVAAWLATHRADFCGRGPAAPDGVARLRVEGAPVLPTTRALSADFVAPAVAGMFYGDLVQRFLPVAIGPLDRSRAVEGAWQRGFAHLPGRPFEQPLEALYAGCPTLPQLVLNATRVETGERVALTRLPTDRSVFINTFDGMQEGAGTRTQTLAGLVHHSARFPLVSPAGTVRIEGGGEGAKQEVPPSFRLVDGGYFDNSGVQSALDLMQVLRKRPGLQAMQPLLLVIRNGNEPFDTQPAHKKASLGLFPESGSIGLALLNVRGSHAVTVRGAARRLLGEDLIDLQVPAQNAEAPLGWALSAAARRELDTGARRLADEQLPKIVTRIAAAQAAASAAGGVR